MRCALPGAAHQHHLLVEMRDDLVAVFPQQIQRHVARARDVRGLELGRRAHIEQPRWRAGVHQLVELRRVDGRRARDLHDALSVDVEAAAPVRVRYHRGYVRFMLTHTPTGITDPRE